MSRKIDKHAAFAWVAYMLTHEPDEMRNVLKYGTPSDRLILLAETPRLLTVEGKLRKVTFPESLNKAAGQKSLFRIAKRVASYLQTIPVHSYALLQQIKATLKARRADTLSNYLMVAEAVCHRAASEFKAEVLFAFDSINTWIKAVYNKELGYHTIRKALEAVEAAGLFKINEWGVRGVRTKATRIELLTSEEYILTYTSNDVDDWMIYLDHGLAKVYQRESIARQDVLEAQIHHYADRMAAELEESKNSAYARGVRLFPATDDMILTKAQIVPIEEKEIWDDAYIDRLLGRLVQPLQENGSNHQKGVPRARATFDES